jgi:hypothetical protein
VDANSLIILLMDEMDTDELVILKQRYFCNGKMSKISTCQPRAIFAQCMRTRKPLRLHVCHCGEVPSWGKLANKSVRARARSQAWCSELGNLPNIDPTRFSCSCRG